MNFTIYSVILATSDAIHYSHKGMYFYPLINRNSTINDDEMAIDDYIECFSHIDNDIDI